MNLDPDLPILGTGKFGTVLLLPDKSALKLSIKDLSSEFYLLQGLNHPNILTVYEFQKYLYKEILYFGLRMEFLEGQTFLELMDRAKLDSSEIEEMIFQFLQGLKYLHDQHIVHSDIKLENLMYDGRKVTIIDFGFATYQDQAAMRTGSFHYAAPEQYEPEFYDHDPTDSRPRDIWAAGVTIFGMLTKRFPYNDVESRTKPISFRLIPPKYYSAMCGMLTANAKFRANIETVINLIKFENI